MKIEFTGRFHKQNNCICDCCLGTGNVVVLKIPSTKYRKSNRYSEPTTEYKELWMCDDCRSMLTNLLNRLNFIRSSKNEEERSNSHLGTDDTEQEDTQCRT